MWGNPIRRLSQLAADTITGAIIQTAAAGARVALGLNAASNAPGAARNDVLRFYSGAAAEVREAEAYVYAGGASPYLQFDSPDFGHGRASLALIGGSADGAHAPYLTAVGAPFYFADGGGAGLRGLDFGRYSGQTDPSGNTLIQHGLGVNPTAILPIATSNSDPYYPTVAPAQITASDFTVRWRHNTTGALAAGGVTVACHWAVLH